MTRQKVQSVYSSTLASATRGSLDIRGKGAQAYAQVAARSPECVKAMLTV